MVASTRSTGPLSRATHYDVAMIRIGTSGWHYKHWRETFYPQGLVGGAWLQYYAGLFSSVEVNNSFYHLLPATSVKAWVRDTPREFLFAVKGSRFITHNKKLKDPKPALKRFVAPLKYFGQRLGPIVFQLPPRWGVNVERLEEFLKALPRRRRYAFELRNPAWHCEPVYEVLRRHNAAFCLFDLAGVQTPDIVTADFIYVRLHGPGGKYQGSYSDTALRNWARKIKRWESQGIDVYIYFDNDQAAYAAHNALALGRILKIPTSAPADARPSARRSSPPVRRRPRVR